MYLQLILNLKTALTKVCYFYILTEKRKILYLCIYFQLLLLKTSRQIYYYTAFVYLSEYRVTLIIHYANF